MWVPFVIAAAVIVGGGVAANQFRNRVRNKKVNKTAKKVKEDVQKIAKIPVQMTKKVVKAGNERINETTKMFDNFLGGPTQENNSRGR